MTTHSVGLVLVTDHLNTENAAYNAVQNFIDVFENAEHVGIIGPAKIDIDRKNVDSIPINRSSSSGLLSRVISYVWYQCCLTLELFRKRHRYDFIFFHVGGSMLLLPTLLCRFVGIHSIVVVTGSIAQSYTAQHGENAIFRGISYLIRGVETITCHIADEVLLLSESMEVPGLNGSFSTPIRVANFNYIDCEKFEKQVPMVQRTYDITFVGRFETVKGIENLVHALSTITDAHPTVRVKLIGDGSLRSELEEIVVNNGLVTNVIFTGWVDHSEIPAHLAESRLLVLPSESEGVPKTILEAMACGTVPVATPVGGIPDIIDDEETGMLLVDNDPMTIARVLDRALDRDDLNEMAARARVYVRDTHSYEATVKRFRKLLAADSEADARPDNQQ